MTGKLDDPTAEELLAAIRRDEANTELTAAYERAWAAIRESRAPEVREAVRKLSVHDLRHLMRAIVPAVSQLEPKP